jgi:hypothetical protein
VPAPTEPGRRPAAPPIARSVARPAPPALRSGSAGVIQRQVDGDNPGGDPAGGESELDVDELAHQVHRRFLRQMAIEGERRGVTSWF